MVNMLNKSLATALTCGAIGLAGTALAQEGAAGSASKNAPAATHTGPGQIDSSAGATIGSGPTKDTGSASASASASAEKPDFLASVQSKSTSARGLKGTAMKRVDQNERKITAELNRASASSTGNANASSQASLNPGSDQNIQ